MRPAAARAEYGAEFRSDVETFISLDVFDRAVVPGLAVRPPDTYAHRYVSFLDAAGGSGTDSITLGIAHAERGGAGADGEPAQGRAVLDRVEKVRSPFSPRTSPASSPPFCASTASQPSRPTNRDR